MTIPSGKCLTITTSGAWKNSTNATIGGVDMLLSPFAMKSLINIEKILFRMTIANFNGNPSPTVISCGSPTNVSEENDVLDFYRESRP